MILGNDKTIPLDADEEYVKHMDQENRRQEIEKLLETIEPNKMYSMILRPIEDKTYYDVVYRGGLLYMEPSKRCRHYRMDISLVPVETLKAFNLPRKSSYSQPASIPTFKEFLKVTWNNFKEYVKQYRRKKHDKSR